MSNRRAFTLLELLLALTVFGIIASSLFAVFHNGMRIQKRVDAINFFNREVMWALDQFQYDIENAVDYDFSGTLSLEEELPFKGQNDTISLITITDRKLEVISYFLADPKQSQTFVTVFNPDGPQDSVTSEDTTQLLIRKRQPLRDYLSGDDLNIEEEILSRRIKSEGLTFSFLRYMDAQSTDGQDVIEEGQSKWVSIWEDAEMPYIVRMNFDYVPRTEEEKAIEISRLAVITEAQSLN